MKKIGRENKRVFITFISQKYTEVYLYIGSLSYYTYDFL